MLIAGRLARGGGVTDGWIDVEGARITAAGDGPPPRTPDDRCDGVIAPGLCDLHVNGAGGHEVDGGAAALDAIDAIQLEHGVTSYLPTLVSADDETAARVLPELAGRAVDPASPVAGVHLEGPFLNPQHAGVHPRSRLRSPANGVPGWLYAARLVTLAPELPSALELVRTLTASRVAVALGHSAADAATAREAAAAGATLATHVFNAMAPLRQRAPGLAGVALVDDRIRPTVIADGVHLDPIVLELARRVARPILVTDSTPAAAAPPGRYRMAGIDIDAAGGASRTPDGTLAGSTLTLDDAVRNWRSMTSATLAEALFAAGELPARAVGLPTGMEAGAPADLIVVSDDGALLRVMRRGRWL